MGYCVVAHEDDLDEGHGMLVNVEGVDIGLFRIDGSVLAYRNDCPHQGGPVCEGIVIGKVIGTFDESSRAVLPEKLSADEIHLVCPWHSYEYNLRSGLNAVDSSLRLQSYPVKVEAGSIFIEI